MNWYEKHVLPRIVDKLLATGQVHKRRRLTASGLRGRVLEPGFGSGLNVGHYPADVEEVVAVEPSDDAWHLAQRRITGGSARVLRTGLDGQRLTEADASVDSVLLTFVLCTIPDQRAALREAHRVLRPGGEVHFLEHGLSPDPAVRTWQHRLEPVQKRLGGGCHLTRDPVQDLEATGFEVRDVVTEQMPGPRFVAPMGFLYRGVAVKPA